jgi:hypothetical protein
LFFLAGGFAVIIVYGSTLTNEYQYDYIRVLFMALPGFAAPFGFLQGFNQMVKASSSLGATGLRLSEVVSTKAIVIFLIFTSFLCVFFHASSSLSILKTYFQKQSFYFIL